MIRKKVLATYCEKMLLQYGIDGILLKLGDKKYEIVDNKELLFDSDFNFLPQHQTKQENDGFVYEFCGAWYLQENDSDVTMQPLKYIGEARVKIPNKSFLGIHSGNELLNGVGLYSQWVKKAKFLGIKTLGICEKNNVGGSLEFQKECNNNDIKPVIGLSMLVKRSEKITYSVKCYCKNFIGWQNLLKFTYKLNVDMEPSIDEQFFIENSHNLHIVIDPKDSPFADYSKITKYYQLDTVLFDDEMKDIEFVKEFKKFISSDMLPVAIFDAYYLEQNEYKVREQLWNIAKSFDYSTKNQYFKSNDEYARELINLFEKGNKSWVKLFKDAQANLETISNECNFQYDTTSRHLPKYKMTESESKRFSSKEKLFIHLIKEGFSKRGIKDKDKYISRLKEEVKVLQDGDVIDYFLVLYDIIKYAEKNNILVGIGRGSAGGSLVSYLLGIIQIDPIEFDLLFARFLNTGRMGSLTECPAYLIETNNGNIKLNEKSIVKVVRNGIEINIYVEDLEIGDEIIKY